MDLNIDSNVNPQSIGFIDAIKKGLKNYAEFNGRATIAEYWWFVLFYFIVACVLGWVPIIGYIITIAVFIPLLALSWRRMHDTGRCGAWWFISWIPIVGQVLWIVWCCQSSEPRENRFGPVPGANIPPAAPRTGVNVPPVPPTPGA